jgi:membrane-bound ClpP family serine protease
MWLIHLLPAGLVNFVVDLLLLAGILGVFFSFFVINTVLKKFPQFAGYYRGVQIASVAVLTLGVYLWGGYSMEMAYQERVKELESQLEKAKEDSAKVNTQIEEKIVYRDRVIREKGETLIQRTETIKEAECKLTPEVLDVHNEAARMNKAIEELRQGAKK